MLPNYQSQLQIIQAWYHLSKELISYELNSTSKRLDIDLKSLRLYIPLPNPKRSRGSQFSIQYQYELWNLFLQQSDISSLYPHYRFPSSANAPHLSPHEYLVLDGYTVCESLFNLCNPPVSSSLILLNFIISFSFAFLPIFFIFLYPSIYSTSAIPSASTSSQANLILFISYHFSAFLINLFLFQALLFILFICIVDTYRKYRSFVLLSALIRTHDIDMDTLQISTTTELAARKSSSVTHHNRQSFLQMLKTSGRVRNESLSSSASATQPQLPLSPSHSQRNRFRKTSILLSDHIAPPSSFKSLRSTRTPPPPHQQHQVSSMVKNFGEGDEDEEGEEAEDDDLESGKEEILGPTETSSLNQSYEFKTYVGDDVTSIVPKIDFDIRANLLTWSSIRLVLHSFGDRMKFRIDCYMSTISSSVALTSSPPLSLSLSLSPCSCGYLLHVPVASLSLSSDLWHW